MTNKTTAKVIVTSVLLAGILLGSTTISNAYAAADTYFIKIDGIPGQSASSDHPASDGWIDVSSYSFGGSIEKSISKKSSNEDFNLFTFVHALDIASLPLEQALISGNTIKHATFQACATNGPQVCNIEYDLSDLKVISVKARGGPAFSSMPDNAPEQVVTLDPCQVDLKFQPLGNDGKPNGPPVTLSTNSCVK